MLEFSIDRFSFGLAGNVATSRPAYDAVVRNPDAIQVILENQPRGESVAENLLGAAFAPSRPTMPSDTQHTNAKESFRSKQLGPLGPPGPIGPWNG